MAVKTMGRKVKGYLLWEIQNYPETKQKLRKYQAEIQNHNKVYVSSLYLQRMEQTAYAIEKVLRHIEPLQIQMLDLIYWRKTHNAAGAGLQIGVSERTVYRWVDQIVYAVGRMLGYWM